MKNYILLSLSLLMCLLVSTSKVKAEDIYVRSTADSGSETLRQGILDAAPGDLIRFSSDLNGQTILLNSPILINKQLIIAGNGSDKTTISGQGKTQVFIVDAPSETVKIQSLTLLQGYSTARGGGIEIRAGDVLLSYVHVAECQVVTDELYAGGGGVYNGDILKVEESTFTDNHARGSMGAGGAILSALGARLLVTSSTLTTNSATRSGGAIQEYANSENYTAIGRATIDNNTTQGPGGAIRFEGPGERSMYLGQIEYNRAGGEGGGVSIEEGQFTVRSVAIQHNEARGLGGGGIASRAAELKVDPKNLIYYNSTAGVGGGVAILNGGKLHINDANISHNTAQQAGGGVAYYAGEGSILIAVNADIDDNEVAGPDGKGGGFYILGGNTISISRCTVIGNRAAGSGGGVWSENARVNLTNTDFARNISEGNEVNAGGGAVWSRSGTLLIRDPCFQDNHATGSSGSGGAIYCQNTEFTFHSKGYFNDNSCGGRGGAICMINGDLTMSEHDFFNNAAFGPEGRGGAVYIEGGALSIRESEVKFNSAYARGGAFYFGPGSTSYLQTTDVVENLVYASRQEEAASGGGIFTEGVSLKVHKSTFSNNSALSAELASGGGVANAISTSTTYFFSTVSGNTTTGTGGGMTNQGELSLSNSTIIHNQAQRGGGIAQASGQTTLIGTAVADNSATAGTADLYSTGGSFTSEGYNLFGNDPNFTILRRTTDLQNVPGEYGPLRDNGGLTLSHRPLAGSPVINMGYPTTSGKYIDQIGQQPAEGRREIGSVEFRTLTLFADFDRDGYGDISNSLQADDPVADYVLNSQDNCPNTYNPDQQDTNADGIGDACTTSSAGGNTTGDAGDDTDAGTSGEADDESQEPE